MTADVDGVPTASAGCVGGPTTLPTTDDTSKDELTTVTTQQEDNEESSGSSGNQNMDFECNNAGGIRGKSCMDTFQACITIV